MCYDWKDGLDCNSADYCNIWDHNYEYNIAFLKGKWNITGNHKRSAHKE